MIFREHVLMDGACIGDTNVDVYGTYCRVPAKVLKAQGEKSTKEQLIVFDLIIDNIIKHTDAGKSGLYIQAVELPRGFPL